MNGANLRETLAIDTTISLFEVGKVEITALAKREIREAIIKEALVRHERGLAGFAARRTLNRNRTSINEKEGWITSFFYSEDVGPEIAVFRVDTILEIGRQSQTVVSLLGADATAITKA